MARLPCAVAVVSAIAGLTNASIAFAEPCIPVGGQLISVRHAGAPAALPVKATTVHRPVIKHKRHLVATAAHPPLPAAKVVKVVHAKTPVHRHHVIRTVARHVAPAGPALVPAVTRYCDSAPVAGSKFINDFLPPAPPNFTPVDFQAPPADNAPPQLAQIGEPTDTAFTDGGPDAGPPGGPGGPGGDPFTDTPPGTPGGPGGPGGPTTPPGGGGGDPPPTNPPGTPGGPTTPPVTPPVSGVPEPDTWAMMFLGVFGIGATLRLARRSSAAKAKA